MDDFSVIRVIEHAIEIYRTLPLPFYIFMTFCSLLFCLRFIADYFLEKDASKRYWERYYAEQKESEEKICLKK
ncbi:hypothetical protein CN639_31355 [Bacillus toyonensis]|uniref:hypothetical protein n=1 Tax=Bacillus toyonensis TaxID=155322 RepID=UPI000BF09416|nr:hypothetical protein [Bacillus toyonensis]PEM79198.1 hypothetical protein CN639_31355 [Bacillus toyonensis]PGD49283.1 hypothetical protein COM38_26955 [Bacillus toyonensis]